jgi:arylsulfatase A-like enzyme
MRWSAPLQEMTPLQMQLVRTFYYAKVTMIDERIGDIVRALEKRGMLNNTWIIYTSDHGENLGDHRLNQKVVFYDSALRVPCIIRPPGGVAGWQSDALTDHLDIVSTMLEAGGASQSSSYEGKSLLAKVKGGPGGAGAQQGKGVIFSEVAGYSMVYDGHYKLTVDSKNRKQVEFLDLKEDPNELSNLVEEPSMAEIRQRMQSEYLDPLLENLDRDAFRAFEERLSRRSRPGIRRES